MSKNKFLDPALWVLIGINTFLVYHYYLHPETFKTLLWIYLAQSVLVGIFNFLDMLTVRSISKQGPSTATTAFWSSRGSAFFFLFHYGFFHVGYYLFINDVKSTAKFDIELFRYFLLAFLAGQIITFIQHKIQQRTEKSDLGRMAIIPYIRIIPMHFTILIPAFLHISNMGVFLILKSAVDVFMYVVTKPADKSRELNTATLASQQNLNF